MSDMVTGKPKHKCDRVYNSNKLQLYIEFNLHALSM